MSPNQLECEILLLLKELVDMLKWEVNFKMILLYLKEEKFELWESRVAGDFPNYEGYGEWMTLGSILDLE